MLSTVEVCSSGTQVSHDGLFVILCDPVHSPMKNSENNINSDNKFPA